MIALNLNGVVDPFEASYVTGGIEAARSEGAEAVLLTIDTPGGLDSSMREITKSILNSPVPVIGYVSPEGARAASAGTFILEACSVAAMAPGTNVGAAHPVGVSGVIEQEKVLNDAAKYIRSIAEARGRNAEWAVLAVRRSVSASAEEALGLHVVDLIEPDTPSLLSTLDGRSVPVAAAGTVTLHTTGAFLDRRDLGIGPSLLHALFSPDLAFIFFYLGLGLIILELIHPGIGVAGVIGVLMLVGSFVSFGMLPVQLIGIVLLVASAIFFVLELKAPGLGVPTVGGAVTLILGGLFLYNSSVPGVSVSPWVIAPVAVAAVAFFGFAVGAALRARRQPTSLPTPDRLVGANAVVTATLAPRGVVLVASEHWSAESISGAIPKGARVRVVGAEGLRLRVAPVEDRPEEGYPTPPGPVPAGYSSPEVAERVGGSPASGAREGDVR